jgi:hypothetical protein
MKNEGSLMKGHVQFATSLALALLAAYLWLAPHAVAQDDAKATDSKTTVAHTVPVIDGAIGTCSAAFTVTDDAAAPVYDVKIRVHIAYGFMYLRKMDLEVSTNIDGKARFDGLPARTKAGLVFQASKADSEGTSFVDSSTTCKSDLIIVLHKKTQ